MFTYSLEHSPCQNVFASGTCVYPEKVCQMFPEDKQLVKLAVEGYVGAPLSDHAGNVIGIMVVLFDQPVLKPALCEQLLRIFAARAANELERSQTVKALAKSERDFRDYTRASADNTWETDSNHRISALGEWPGRVVELSPSELLGKTRWELAGADPDADPLWREHQALLEAHEEFRDFRYTIIPQNGKAVHLSVSGVPVFDEKNRFTGYRGTTTNVTSEFEAENQRAMVERRLQIALHAAELFPWDWRIEGSHTTWGRNPEPLLGTRPAEGYPHFVKMVVDEDREKFLEANQRCRMEGQAYLCEFRVQKTDGEVRWLEARGQLIRDMHGAPERIIGVSQDITQRKQTEQDLRLSATVFESGEPILIADAEGIILNVNTAFEKLCGYSRDYLIGKKPRTLNVEPYDEEAARQFWQELTAESQWRGEFSIRRRGGEIRPMWVVITAVFDSSRKISHYVSTYTDLSERRQTEQRIRKLADYDALTDLPNRSRFADLLNQKLGQRLESLGFGGVLIIDLDGFRTINESLGYQTGDELLKLISKQIVKLSGDSEKSARLGADEFAILVHPAGDNRPQATSRLREISNQVMDVVSRPVQIGEREMYLSCTIGISLFNSHSHSDAEEILAEAEIAMHQARSEGYSTSRMYRPNMRHRSDTRLRMINILAAALSSGELECFYQKQVDADGRLVGVESLARLRHPDSGIISPHEFIGVAEETGLIVPLGDTVLDQSLAAMARWRKAFQHPPGFISVNVSPHHFLREGYAQSIEAALLKHKLPGSCLELEITENLLVADFHRVSGIMNILRDIGVRFAIDDFGVGYSSMSYLKRLPIDKLKLDRSFVLDLGKDDSSDAIVDATLSIGKALDLEVLAEGVETADTFNRLCDLGCALFQGFYFGQTVSAGDFETELERIQLT